ncbi:MAG: CDP-alcohol phosphatidyltransferase family protein, partial [Alphaproteobacteria bacterium]
MSYHTKVANINSNHWLTRQIPNVITLSSIVIGLTAIRYGFQSDFESAALLILLSCIFDGLDGRVARLLQCQSKFGAELDSLADVMNFGVAPALIIYLWT